MATSRTLWRLDGATEQTLQDAARLASSLRVHLAHHDLVAVLMQLAGRQQLYLSLCGCSGCTLGRCEPGCPRDLLGRALSRCFSGARMHAVPGGLASRPYQHIVSATPGSTPAALNGAYLHDWPEARLVIHWHRGSQLQVGALLAVPADGPPPKTILREAGWQTARTLPFQRQSVQAIATGVASAGAWPDTPWLPLPFAPGDDVLSHHRSRESGQSSEGQQERQAALAERLSTRLAPLLEADPEADRQFFCHWAALAPITSAHIDGASGAANDLTALAEMETTAPEPPESSIWPAGPGRMRPADVGFLIEQIRTSPIVQTGNEPGVTRRRVAQLLPDDLSEYSRQLVYWLHLAGLLTPPTVADEPFRNPRPLIALPDEALAAQLASTAVPSPEQARAAMQR